ncbi:hypothetical protein [Parafrankia discariae]|uniref:hypothetical protein n=1 Tax=Parafrankia discariae TaxID=365528 RepID=UPI00035CB330|nr:hypothetical protein [Parafrankia discariae]
MTGRPLAVAAAGIITAAVGINAVGVTVVARFVASIITTSILASVVAGVGAAGSTAAHVLARRFLAACAERRNHTRSLLQRIRCYRGEDVPQAPAAGLTNQITSHLLGQAASALPGPVRERFAEEWADHRSHYRGWRLLWWALCVRATATRTARELRAAQLPHPDR